MVAKKKKTVKRKVVIKKSRVVEDPTYVRIDNAMTFRKNLLRTAIEAGTLLKKIESYKLLKELKMKEIKNLHAIMGEIEKEFRKFKSELPKVKEYQEDKKIEVSKPVERVEEKKIDHLSGLDAEIEDIKQKLAELNL
jgi:hypothetical protein